MFGLKTSVLNWFNLSNVKKLMERQVTCYFRCVGMTDNDLEREREREDSGKDSFLFCCIGNFVCGDY